MPKPVRVAFLIVILIACAASSAQTQLSPAVRVFVKLDAPTIALTHVRIIDGTGGPAHDDQSIVISAGKIQSLGNAASVTIPADAKVVDLTGKTAIPGLVGMHDHMFYPAGGGIFHEMAISFPRLY